MLHRPKSNPQNPAMMLNSKFSRNDHILKYVGEQQHKKPSAHIKNVLNSLKPSTKKKLKIFYR